MQWQELRKEVANGLGNFDERSVNEVKRQFDFLVDELDYIAGRGVIDVDQERAIRIDVARRALELLQRAVPALNQLGTQCLEFAGKDAVRVVCAPIERIGTGYDGQPLQPIPSRYTLPPGYESVVAAVAGKVKAALSGR